MKKKIIAITIIVLCLTGCTCKYDITINEDLTFQESINLDGDKRFEITSDYTVDSMFDIVSNTYENYYDPQDKDKIIKSNNNGNLSLSLEKEYQNLKDINNSYYLKMLYQDGLTVTENRDKITITGNSLIKEFWLLTPQMDDEALIKELRLTIKLPYLVLENNADKVDKKNNTYTYIYNFDNEYKSLNLVFDKTVKYNYQENNYIIYIFIGVAIVILGIMIYLFIKNKNKTNNNI